MSEHVFRINVSTGVMKTLWTDELDLASFGTLTVTRASNVEFSPERQAWFVALPSGEKIAEGFVRRIDALAFERDWANQSLLK